jgi:hypothetical protein
VVDWFNHRRLLEPIGHVPPAEFEAAYHPREDPSRTLGLKHPSLRQTRGGSGSVGSELDHLLGGGAGYGADELAGEEDLQHGGVELDGHDLASEVPAG